MYANYGPDRAQRISLRTITSLPESLTARAEQLGRKGSSVDPTEPILDAKNTRTPAAVRPTKSGLPSQACAPRGQQSLIQLQEPPIARSLFPEELIRGEMVRKQQAEGGID